jgi:hypothetical protein
MTNDRKIRWSDTTRLKIEMRILTVIKNKIQNGQYVWRAEELLLKHEDDEVVLIVWFYCFG